MSEWGFWDWVAYVTTWIAAIVVALGAAIRAEPHLRRKVPVFFKRKFWAFLPLALLLVGLISFLHNWLAEERTAGTLMEDYGSNGQVYFFPGRADTLQGVINAHIIIEGRSLSRLGRTKYKVAGVCYHFFSGDKLDAKNLSKSGLYDIREEKIQISILWNKAYVNELVNGAVRTVYTVLAVPVGVNPDQFDTLRQAVALGAKILDERTGPP